MIEIGIPKETGANGYENRVMLLPEEVKKLIDLGHNVFVERDAAKRIFVEDKFYSSVGAKILDEPKEIFSKRIVVKLKAPSNEEFNMLNNNLLFSMLHAEQNPEYLQKFKENNVNAIAMEMICNKHGDRFVDCTYS